MTAARKHLERQMSLTEIGVAGQERIERGQLRLGVHLDELGREVARRYAQGAGMAREIEGPPEQPALLAVFRHAPARSVAAGALAALGSLTEALRA